LLARDPDAGDGPPIVGWPIIPIWIERDFGDTSLDAIITGQVREMLSEDVSTDTINALKKKGDELSLSSMDCRK
jgi:hypothetical protein